MDPYRQVCIWSNDWTMDSAHFPLDFTGCTSVEHVRVVVRPYIEGQFVPNHRVLLTFNPHYGPPTTFGNDENPDGPEFLDLFFHTALIQVYPLHPDPPEHPPPPVDEQDDYTPPTTPSPSYDPPPPHHLTPDYSPPQGGSSSDYSPQGGFGYQMSRDVAGLSIDTPQDDGWGVFSKKNKNRGETRSPKQWGTRIVEEVLRDHEIVWPPMVLLRYHVKDDNEKVDKDGNEKWISSGNRKLPDFYALMAKHPCGPKGLFDHFPGCNAVEARYGHKGMSLLIFENSAIGYVEAERLHKHFADQGTNRDAWDRCKLLGTRHQFYGYMANKEDIDIFNQHCRGGTKVKFEMRSHHEMVVIPMDGDNPRLFLLHGRAVKGEQDAKGCQEWYGKWAEMLREKLEENRIVRQRTKMQHEQNNEEVHCELAEILDEELCETVCDSEIVWPPMVVIRYHEKDDNVKVDQDDNEKWISSGNRKLPDFYTVMAKHPCGPLGLFHHFPGCNAVEARYGHKGMSLLIFESSAIGYVEAERLHIHFADQGTDRNDGTRHKFYGYMANKEDIDIFNQHCQGGTKVKFEMRSHHEMVVIPMDGDNPRLFLLHGSAVKAEKDAKARQEYYGKVAEMLRETLEENRIVRQRTKMQHEQNKEKQSIVDFSAANEELRQEEISKFIQNLVAEKTEMWPKYSEEKVKVEKMVDTALH